MNSLKFKDFSNSWNNLWNFILFFTFIVFLLLSYLQAELLTFLYSSKAPIREFCKQIKPFEVLIGVKIIYLEKQKREMQVYCLYQNSQENLKLTLVRQLSKEVWKVLLIEKLNKDGNLYWPIYF